MLAIITQVPRWGQAAAQHRRLGPSPPGVVDPFASSSTRTRPPRSPPPQAMAGSAAAQEESEREGGRGGDRGTES
ncbi:MAG: hypothetical protein WDW36_006951 [Sanguina aurantia]